MKQRYRLHIFFRGKGLLPRLHFIEWNHTAVSVTAREGGGLSADPATPANYKLH